MIAFARYYDLRVSWLAKQSLFTPPLGWLMRALGGIPVARHVRQNMVSEMVDAFHRNEQLALVIPTEGTRDRADYWKSGFYHIARTAEVPIVPCFLDYSRRRGGFGEGLVPGPDVRADMNYFRDFYADKVGLHPEQSGPVRLREEESDEKPPV
jgi:1-acyl-sn-glycerol-3-phosphate acyltransferase